MVNIHLPEDLICTEIFSRLPTKSVGKFRCLSKTWRNRLSSSEFIYMHLTRKPHQEHPATLSGGDVLCLITCSTTMASIDAALCQRVQLPKTWKSLIGSRNGLVLLNDFQYNMFLLNPITMEHFKVPASTFTWEKATTNRTCQFCYDSSTDDYKIVNLSFAEDSPGVSVEVYSLKTCVWKGFIVDNYPYFSRRDYADIECFVNGAMHWSATNVQSGMNVIVAFDLANEVFSEIPSPTSSYCYHLVILRGCLSYMADSDETLTGFDIWRMSEYGVLDSWTKFITVNLLCLRVIPWFLDGNDEFVLGSTPEGLVLCNMKERTTRGIEVDGFPEGLRGWLSFTDSLVSPNQLASSSYQ